MGDLNTLLQALQFALLIGNHFLIARDFVSATFTLDMVLLSNHHITDKINDLLKVQFNDETKLTQIVLSAIEY